MKSRLTYMALALVLGIGACDGNAPTANRPTDGQPSAPEFKKESSTLLRDVPVTGTTSTGAAFAGTVTIKKFALDHQTGALLVSGELKDATGEVVAKFHRVAATLESPTAGVSAAATCSILDLDIGAIHLNLLGLVVDLAPVHLDITGQTGSGQLLGNLLCGLAGLLDGFPGTLAQILDILREINQLLG